MIGTAINNQYGGEISDWIWQSMHPLTRPRGMTRLEERHWDRTCVGSNDPCAALKAATRNAIEQARAKMARMQQDPNDLYNNARSVPNPLVTGSPTTWDNHGYDLSGRLENIAAMISLGQKMGCDMHEEAREAANLFVPSSPKR